MAGEVRFERRETVDKYTRRKADEVVVIRDGQEVAALPDASRLDRALSLPLEEVEWVAAHFREIMHRDPTPAEKQFWQAVLDRKRALAHRGEAA